MRWLTAIVVAWRLSGQDAAEIVRQSIDRDANNIERLKNYAFLERQEEKYFDKRGKISSTESETSEILILGGRPYARKVAKNDRPLSEKDVRKEQAKLDREADKRSRESASDKAKLEKDRLERRKFLKEVPDAFTLKLLGTESISGKPAWVVDATPKPGYKPKNRSANVLSKVHAKLWIDQSEYQWVKVEADVLDAISWGLGLLKISPGGTVKFEQMRMNDEIWVPQSVAVKADARLGYVKRLRGEINVSYRDYRKFQTDSHLIAGEGDAEIAK